MLIGHQGSRKTSGIVGILNKHTGGLAGKLLDVGKAAKKGGAAMRTALISTGIGALVVAVGLLAANWESIIGLVDGVSGEQTKLLAETEKTNKANQDNLAATEASENSLKLQGKSEKEILDLKIKQTDEVIASTELLLEQQESIKKSQLASAERNQKIAAGIIAFMTAPITVLLGAVDALTYGLAKIGVIAEGTNLAAGFTMGAAKMLGFDPEEVKTKGEETTKETENQLRALKNKRDGFVIKGQEDAKKASDKALSEKNKADAKILEAQKKADDLLKEQRNKVDKIREDFFNRNKDLDAKTTKERLELQRQAAQEELNLIKLSNNEKIEAQEQLDRFFLQKEFDLLEELSALKKQSDEDFALSQAQFEASRIQDPLAKLDAERVNLENERLLVEEDLQAKVDLYKVGDIERLQAENDLKNALQEIDNEITLNADKEAEARTEIAQIEADTKRAINMATIDTVLDGIGLLKSAFEGNKGMQKALLVAESLAGIAKIVVSTQAANAADTAHAATLGPAGVAYLATKKVLNKINAGIGIAANIVATKKALSALGGGGGVSASGNTDSGGSAPAAPSFNVVGTSGVNQLAQSIQGQQQPIEAYVVGANVTSQQALDRNITETASIF